MEKGKFLFKCPCGREKVIGINNRKATKSCGCKQKESIIGKSFGFLKVLSLATENDLVPTGVICSCACGNTVCLPQGRARTLLSCGSCKLSTRLAVKEPSFNPYDLSQPSPTTDPRYRIYVGAKYRCRGGGHKDYGGRGIRFLWNNFKEFCDDMGERAEGLTLERLDVNSHYCKENCIWADWETQSNNKRSNVFVTVGGLTMTIAQWERYTGLSDGRARERVNLYGWSIEAACSTPSIKFDVLYITIDGQTLSAAGWDEKMGFRKGTVKSRIRNGWDEKRACLEPLATNELVTALGMTKTVPEWEAFHGLKSGTIRSRVSTYGWTLEAACSIRKGGSRSK